MNTSQWVYIQHCVRPRKGADARVFGRNPADGNTPECNSDALLRTPYAFADIGGNTRTGAWGLFTGRDQVDEPKQVAPHVLGLCDIDRLLLIPWGSGGACARKGEHALEEGRRVREDALVDLELHPVGCADNNVALRQLAEGAIFNRCFLGTYAEPSGQRHIRWSDTR